MSAEPIDTITPISSPAAPPVAVPGQVPPGAAATALTATVRDQPRPRLEVVPGRDTADGIDGAERATPKGVSWDGESDLSVVPTRVLRMMCNSAFKELDVDYPAWGAVDRYRVLVAACEERAASAAGRGPHEAVPAVAREAFRDNTVVSRFELFLDGRLAGYAKYTLVAGLLTVDLLFVPTAFRGLGFEDTILRLVSLSAHKRRLALVLRCREAPVFVRDNPSYAALLPRTAGTPGTVERVPDERAEPDLIEN